jgi:membrane protease YdiL (CAAX protease family)
MIQWWFHLVFLWLAVVMPLLTWLRRKRFRRGTSNLDTRRLYLRVIVGQWVLALGVVYVFWKLGIPLEALGLVAPEWIATASLFAAVVVAAFLGTWRLRAVLKDPEKLAKIRARAAGLSQLVPMTDEEERWWIVVSITAGVCEEILYRGYLGFYLGRSMPLPWVAVVASVFFGLAHLYQGPKNAGRTLIAGFLFWGTYLLTGSIVPGMVLHAFIDIRSGRALRRAFTEPAPIAAEAP